MLKTVTFFSTEKDLTMLTGLDHDGLWEAGFDLDDWDWGVLCSDPLSDEWDVERHYEQWLLDRMESYCVGYKRVVFHGKNFYMVYHS